MDVVGDESNHLGPIKLMMDVLDCLGDARVSSQTMIIVGAQDIQSDVPIVRDIEQSLVMKEVSIFLK